MTEPSTSRSAKPGVENPLWEPDSGAVASASAPSSTGGLGGGGADGDGDGDGGSLSAFGLEATQLVGAIERQFGPQPAEVRVGFAATVRGIANGNVCIDLDSPDAVFGSIGARPMRAETDAQSWDDPGRLLDVLRRSDLVEIEESAPEAPQGTPRSGPSGRAVRPLVLAGTNLYLRRYHDYEVRVAERIRGLAGQATPGQETPGQELPQIGDRAREVLDRYFPDRELPGSGPSEDAQLRAVIRSMADRFLILAGGPGTGKTRTVAVILQLLAAQNLGNARPLRIALTAPTGKAAARMTDAVLSELGAPAGGLAEIDAVGQTIHRLLGWRPPDRQRGEAFRHDHDNPLPYDVVIVDEASMVSMPLMDALLDAVADSARVILVGDPYQLASVESGSVLMDLVEPVLTQEASEFVLRDRIVVLDRSRRFRPDSAIAELAETIRRGDVHAAVNLLERSAGPPSDHLIGDTASDTELAWIPIPDSWEPGLGPVGLCADPVVSALIESMIAARVGPAAAGDIHASMVGEAADKLLCVTRVGPLGSTRWNELFDSIARQRLGPWTAPGSWFPGRPLMVTRNDPLNQLFNGDSGVVVARPGQPDAVGFPHGHEARIVEFARIESAEPNWAMTVHKSQGSEFDHVIVVVPPPPMRTLTRELLYTAITRARHRVTILGSSEGFAEGVRRRISRASGLTDRLVGPSSRITGGSAADSNREAGG